MMLVNQVTPLSLALHHKATHLASAWNTAVLDSQEGNVLLHPSCGGHQIKGKILTPDCPFSFFLPPSHTQTHTHTHTQKHTHTHTHRNTHTETHRNSHTHTHRNTHT